MNDRRIFHAQPLSARVLAVAALTLAASTTALAGSEADFRLTVLHNNDGESQLIDAGSGLEDFGGVARFATRLKILRSIAEEAGDDGIPRGAITVTSGDNFLAGPEFNASLMRGIPFYDTIALDLIRYDALCIGNHEFDFGPDVLADLIVGFRTRPHFLSANLDFSGEPRLQALVDERKISASRVVRKNGQLIGIVGATTEALQFISSPRNVIANDVLPAVQSEVDRLQELGVNKIVLISHLQSVDEDIALVAQLSGVDIAIAGGGDELLANEDDLLIPGDEANPDLPYPILATDADGATVPVVTTSGNYKYVGQLVVDFDADGNVIGIDDAASGPKRVAGGDNEDAVPNAPWIFTYSVFPVIEALEALAENVIATSEVALDGIRANVRSIETNEGNLIADAIFWQAEQLAGDFGAAPPDIALQNGGGIRNDDIRGPGDITELDTFDILPFGNFVALVPDIGPLQLKEVLENAVSRVEFGDGRFAQVAGLTLEWDPLGTPQIIDPDTGNITQIGDRVVNVTLDDGTLVVSDGVVDTGAPALDIAILNFLAGGGDQYPLGDTFISLGVSDQQALTNYIVDGLGGVITAVDYPEGGEGRVVEIQ